MGFWVISIDGLGRELNSCLEYPHMWFNKKLKFSENILQLGKESQDTVVDPKDKVEKTLEAPSNS